MKMWAWLIGLALMPGLRLQAQTAPSSQAPSTKIVDRIVAQVNDDIITLSELEREKIKNRQLLEDEYTGEQLERELARTEPEILNTLIEKRLMLQRANELGIGAGLEVDVSTAIENLRKKYNIPDMETFERALEQSGTTMAVYREEIKENLILQQLRSYFVDSRITLLTEEVERFYKDHAKEFSSPEEVTLSEILIPAEGQGQSLAAEYRKRASQGESFAALASQVSKGATANKGGSIGTYLVSKLSENIAKAIANVKEGDISEVVLLPEGYTFFRIDARKLPIIKPFEEVKADIKNYLWQQKYRPEYDRFIAQLKEDAYIQIFSELGIGK